MNIWTHKFTLNSKNAQFLMALTQNVLQVVKKSSEYGYLTVKSIEFQLLHHEVLQL